MESKSKPLETFAFAALPGFVIYDWIYEPRHDGQWFLISIALILLWLFAVFMLFCFRLTRDEPEGGEPTWPSVLYSTLALINVIGFGAMFVINLLRPIAAALFGEPSIYE